MKVAYSIKMHDRAWVGVKTVLDHKGNPVDKVVWSRRAEDAARFSKKAFAEEFILINGLHDAVVKGD